MPGTAMPALGRQRAARVPAPVRRTQILDAAIELFARTGFHDGSTAALAARLGVSEPTLYRHFPSKRALYVATLDHSAELLLGHWRTLAWAAPTPLDALLEVGRWYFDQLGREPGHLLLRFRSFGHAEDAVITGRVRAHFVEVFRFVHELYEAARSQGQIAATADTRAHTWLFMAIGALLDTTQVLGLRGELRLEDMPAIMAIASPPGPTARKRPRRRPGGRR